MKTVSGNRASYPRRTVCIFLFPLNIVFGRGKANQVGNLAKVYSRRVLIVTGQSGAKKSDFCDREDENLKTEGMHMVFFDKLAQNSHNRYDRRGRTCQNQCMCWHW